MNHPLISKIDFDYIGAFLFETAVDPADMIDTANPYDGLADAPPPISGYRQANVVGMACWNCGHFTAIDDADGDGVPDGICNLWEAKADGGATCDRFTAHADLYRQSAHTSWQEDMANEAEDQARFGPSVESVDYADNASLNEIQFTAASAVEEDGLIWKDILRTGEWKQIPTNKGIFNKTLQILAEGESDPENGIISLSELESNFNEGAVPYVTVPLSDDAEDHKNIARMNTGFVRKLKKVARDGMTVLRAGIEFTEPDVKEKVLRGTIPDCSAGVPFGVTRRRDNKFFRTVLDHVCLTKKPFIDGLSPFSLQAADDQAELPVEAWEEEAIPAQETETTPAPEQPPENQNQMSFRSQQVAIHRAIVDQLGLAASDYVVEDILSSTTALVRHRAGVAWEVPFRLTGDEGTPVRVASVDNWKTVEEEKSETESSQPTRIAAADGLRNAHELRELRLAQPPATGGIHMSVSTPSLSLEGVELSDEARQRVQGILTENENLRRRTREGEITTRIGELEELGLKDRPGALKLYRQVMLSDDGGPAVILFSDSEDESKKESLTALNILDRFIEALKADGGVVFSDQALSSGSDDKPPANADGEKRQLDERIKDANTALYGNEEGQVRRRRRPTRES